MHCPSHIRNKTGIITWKIMLVREIWSRENTTLTNMLGTTNIHQRNATKNLSYPNHTRKMRMENKKKEEKIYFWLISYMLSRKVTTHD